MKLIARYYFFISVTSLLIACQDVVDVEIFPNNTKSLVVEAILFSDLPIPNNEIILSRSSDYTGEFNKDYVSGASVYLLSSDGDSVIFKMQSPGEYKNISKTITTTKEYQLNIMLEDGSSYQSSWVSPPKSIAIDSLSFFSNDYVIDNMFGIENRIITGDGYYPAIEITTDENENYFLSYIVLAQRIANIYNPSNVPLVETSTLKLGNKIPFEFLWFNHSYQLSESATVIQLSLNEDYFTYLSILKNNLQDQNPFSSSPSPLKSNVRRMSNSKEKVFGYFTIVSSSRKTRENFGLVD